MSIVLHHSAPLVMERRDAMHDATATELFSRLHGFKDERSWRESACRPRCTLGVVVARFHCDPDALAQAFANRSASVYVYDRN